MKTIFIDESGYTGHNYLDPNQPIFVIASSDIYPKIAEAILKDSFPNYKGEEFKLSNIWDSSNYMGLLSLVNYIHNQSSVIFSYYVNKEYLVLIHMIEWLIEPHQTFAGYNFYAGGYCKKLTNFLFYMLTEFEPIKLLPEMIKGYQEFSRSPTLESLTLLKSKLNQFSSQLVHKEVKKIIADMAIACDHLPNYTKLEDFKSTNEMHLTTILASVSWWRQNFDDDFIIYHDVSSNFNRQKGLWEKITNKNVYPYQLPLGDGGYVQFPLRVLETISEDSKNNYSIQFCDIIAGLITKFFDNRIVGDKREFLNKLFLNGLSKVHFNGLMPERDFPTGPPIKLNGPDAVDLLSKHLK